MSSLFRINNNIAATFAQRQLTSSNQTLNEAQERLSSGKRINTAADDAAGLAISEKLRQGLRGLQQAQRNAQDGISVLQTAEGGLESINDKLQRIRELAVQSANDSLTNSDRKLLQEEVNQLVDEIDRTASSVQFNNRQLLGDNFKEVQSDGSVDSSTAQSSLKFHVGANRGETIEVTKTDDIQTTTGNALGVRTSGTAIEITSQGLAESAIEITTDALDTVSTTRANIGAVQNRLEGTIDFLEIQQEKTQASESRIRDADVASEAVKRTRANILLQAGTSVLSQAQQTPQLALQLLG